MIQRLSIGWDGALRPSPHGDYVEYCDLVALQDELEELRKRLAATTKARLDLELKAKPAAAGGRLFGWVNPNDARKFNSGHKESCRVFKKKTEVFCMPLSNKLGPNHYQKPPVGATVTVLGGKPAVVIDHIEQGLLVDLDGVPGRVSKWSWRP